MIFNSIKFRRVPSFISILFGMLFFFHSQNILAAQKALITSERAIIYADPIMTSPIGYLSKGKKILISEKSKNRGQVFALIVAGKIAYISSSDISTELESVESSQLSAERFQRQTLDKRHSSYSLLGFIYPSKINFGKANGKLKSGDLLHWNGLSLKGSTEATSNYDLDFVFNYMSAVNSSERFKAVELGLGLSWKILKNQKTDFKFYSHGFLIPFSSYEIEDKFRKNSFGAGLGAGLNWSYLFDKNFGMEVFAGGYLNSLATFHSPRPYNELTPWLFGTRVGLGLNYHY